MTKEKYMALADFQSLWTQEIKPYIGQTYATKQEAGATFASNDTCKAIIEELT